MQDDYLGNDPGKIWRNQPTEPPPITVLLIRKKTRELHAKTRGELLKSISGPLIVVILGGFGLRFPDPATRVIFVFATAWSMAGLYFLNRRLWSAAPPEEAALRGSLESYRREIERRRFLFSRVLQWNLGPVLLVIATWILMSVRTGVLNRTTLPKAAPFLTVLAVWLAAMVFVRMRHQKELQREIYDLSEIERANR